MPNDTADSFLHYPTSAEDLEVRNIQYRSSQSREALCDEQRRGQFMLILGQQRDHLWSEKKTPKIDIVSVDTHSDVTSAG